MNRTAPEAPITNTVSGLSDRRLVQRLKELTAVEHQLEVVVIDHLRELERRRLYLSWGFSSLFDYATRELGYSEAAAWRRIKAMRLCGEVEGARERMRDGSLTLNAAALLQNAFDRQERKRKQSGGGSSAQAGVRSAAPSNGSAPNASALPAAPSAPAQAEERPEESRAAPVLDSSARQALMEEASGKSTRQVEKLLAGVDPELAAPVDRMRPLGAGRWEIKAVIDDDCRRGLEQIKGLLSHVDPHMTLGQLVERAVREAVERHDPARPPRGRRTGSRATPSGADETSAPKEAGRSDATSAQRNAAPAGGAGETSAPKEAGRSDATSAQRNAAPTGGADGTSTSNDAAGPDAAGPVPRPAVPSGVTTSAAKEHADSKRPRAEAANRLRVAVRPSAPKGATTSVPKAPADSVRGHAAPAKRPAGGGCTGTSAPKADGGRHCHAAPPQSQIRGRAIPAAVRRQVWERDQGCCSYVDRGSGRRCGSRHQVQIDHILPFALGGSAEPGNLRLLCAAHHRHRHADRSRRLATPDR